MNVDLSSLTLDAAWAIILGVVAVFTTALANQAYWPSWLKRLITAAVSFVLAGLYAVASGRVDGVPPELRAELVRWIIIAAVVLALSQAYYPLLKGAATTLENKTTLQPAALPGPAPSPAPGSTTAQDLAEDTSGTPPSELDED